MDFPKPSPRESMEENFYQYFSLDRDATLDQINIAYRRLSKIYHPDRHSDPNQKILAANLFNKIKRIHEVLSDPQKRAIYDSVGSSGLEIDGWQIMERTKTAQEIRREFEKLFELEEEKKIQMATNPHGSIHVNLNATDLFMPYDIAAQYDEEFSPRSNIFVNLFQSFVRSLYSIEVSGVSISQSVEAPITPLDTMVLSGSVNSKNGTGSGEVTTSIRHVHSADKWTEAQLSVGNGFVSALKHFRALTTRCYLNSAFITQLFPDGTLRPGAQLTLSQQLDKHTTGQLSLNLGIGSSLVSSVIRQTEKSRFFTSFHLGIPHSYLHVSYTRHIFPPNFKIKSHIKLGTFGGMLEYGCEQKINQHTVLGAYVSVGIPFGVNLTVKVNRAQQNFSFVTLLSQELIPAPIIYGTVAPVLTYLLVKHVIVDPYLRRQEQKIKDEEKSHFADRLQEQRREAQTTVNLMAETFKKIQSEEDAKLGLLIQEALYGNISKLDVYRERVIHAPGPNGDIPHHILPPSMQHDHQPYDVSIIDVTIPLQCLVYDSKLTVPQGSKANLAGFYDPCYSEDKQLYVRYTYRTVTHEITYDDEDAIRIPHSTHKVSGLNV